MTKCIDCKLNEADKKWDNRCNQCQMLGTYFQYEICDGNFKDFDERLKQFKSKMTLADIEKLRVNYWEGASEAKTA